MGALNGKDLSVVLFRMAVYPAGKRSTDCVAVMFVTWELLLCHLIVERLSWRCQLSRFVYGRLRYPATELFAMSYIHRVLFLCVRR